MKKYTIFLLILSSLFACNQDEIERLEQENSKLIRLSSEKDSSINDMMSTFNEIEENLAEIKNREQMVEITSSDPETGGDYDRTEKIQEDIQMINFLLEENRKMIQNLNSQLESSNLKVEEFRTMVNRLNKQIAEKDQQIANLRNQLATMNIKMDSLHYTIDTLALENQRKQKVIEQKITEVNTAYYAYGTFEELEAEKVLAKTGGFLGIGKDIVLRDDFNKDYFSKIDITKQKSFLIYANEAELLTSHPKGSYEFKGTEDSVDSLVINSPEEFWKASKYMVIVVEQD